MNNNSLTADKIIAELFDDFKNIRKLGIQNLKKIIADNKNTDYGKDNGFSDILSEEDYVRKIPVTAFSDYAPYLENGRSITAYPIVCMLLTSGTMGKQKTFPITEEALERYSTYVNDMAYSLMGGKEGPHFFTAVFRPPVDGKSILSSAYYHYFEEKGSFDSSTYAGGKELLFTDKTDSITYVKAWTALSCAELISIQSIFIYDVLILMSYIEENHKKLISDMRNGTFSESLDESVCRKLLSIRPSAERLDELEKIFAEGFEKPTVSRIWKNIKFISGAGGNIFEVQEKALKKYTGDIPFFYYGYASSECFSGLPIEMNKPQYALMPKNGYYEFLSVKDNIIYPIDKISVGSEYELIITTFSGLYRYATGDLITIERFEGETPVISITGRRNHVLNISGEKLDEGTARIAVKHLSEEIGVKFTDFAIGIDTSAAPEKYMLFAEAEDIPENTGKLFDKHLCELSSDYCDLRNLMNIGEACALKMQKGEIGRRIAENGRNNIHNKPHIFLDAKQTALLSDETEDKL